MEITTGITRHHQRTITYNVTSWSIIRGYCTSLDYLITNIVKLYSMRAWSEAGAQVRLQNTCNWLFLITSRAQNKQWWVTRQCRVTTKQKTREYHITKWPTDPHTTWPTNPITCNVKRQSDMIGQNTHNGGRVWGLNKKPCYCKGDRAMRRTCAWPGQFRKSLTTPMATIAEIVTGLLLRWIVWKRIQNQKFVAITVPEITVSTFKFWAAPGYAHTSFSHKYI